MGKKKNTDSESTTGADELVESETPPVEKETGKRKEPCVSLAELLAMRKVPDHHAHALKVYAGTVGEMPLSEWEGLYAEMMSKPTDMPKEQWHAEFKKQDKR